VFGLTLLVGSIGIADSINPSTVAPALYLASRPRAVGLGVFIAGVFGVYLAGGIVLVLGPGPQLIAALRGIGPQVERLSEAGAGAVLLALAALAWRARNRPIGGGRTLGTPTRRSAFLLGAGISAVELPTAFMYFGAVSAILGSQAALPARIALVVAYNALFVLPLVAVLLVRVRAGAQAERRLAAAGSWMRSVAPVALGAIMAVAGVVLAIVGVSGLLASA
jgi:cytochrome c biogenesis protein CcdA